MHVHFLLKVISYRNNNRILENVILPYFDIRFFLSPNDGQGREMRGEFPNQAKIRQGSGLNGTGIELSEAAKNR